MKKTTILLPAIHPSYALKQVRWALNLEKEDCHPLVFSTLGKSLDRMIAGKSLRRPAVILHPPSGLGWMTQEDDVKAKPPKTDLSPSFSRRMLRTIPGFLEEFCVSVFLSFKSVRLFIRGLGQDHRRIKHIRKVIRDNKVDAVVLVETSAPYEAPLYVRAAHLESIPVVSCPTGRDCPLAYASIYKTDKTLTRRSPLKKIIELFFPKWVIAYHGFKILRLPDYDVLKQIFLKTASPEPWQAIGQIEDYVFAQSQVDADYYQELGVPSSKFKVIGGPEYDELKQKIDLGDKLKKEVCKELSLDPTKPILLTSLVQSHWVSGREEAEFQNYEDLLRAWLKPLYEQDQFSVIVSLHPSHKYEELHQIQTENLKISRKDVTQLIAVCDLFVTFLSSITPLAIAAGKPVLNYDVYRYTVEVPGFGFDRAEGAITVTTFEGYSAAVRNFSQTPGYLSEVAQNQLHSAALWGVLDGGSTQRLLSEIRRISSSRPT